MTIGVQNLSSQITTRLAASPTGLTCCQLEGARDILETASVESVASVAALPNPLDNKGRFFFVQDICAFRYSDGVIWTNEYYTGSCGTIAYAWGCNTCGLLGDNSVVTKNSPVTTSGGVTTWCQISAGFLHTAAVKTDGTAWTWGFNSQGRLGNNSVVARSSPGTTEGGGTTWCQISAGYHTAAVKTDGTAWTWGRNYCGQLGNGTAGFGSYRSSPITTSGGGYTWCQISASMSNNGHTAAVKTDGTAWSWGANNAGQLGNCTIVSSFSPITPCGGGFTWCQISAGFLHTVAVKTDGTAWTWGVNAQGRLGNNSVAARSSPGITEGGGTTWCQISAGYHTAAVKTDGTAWTWGINNSGQLGNGLVGASSYRSSPVITSGGGTTWCQIHAGDAQTAALKTDGTAWTWGRNGAGQLGDGSFTGRSSPGNVSGGGTTWCQISAGACHTAAIKINTSPLFSEPL